MWNTSVLAQYPKAPEVCSSGNKVREVCYTQLYLCPDSTQALGGHEGYLAKRSLGWEKLKDEKNI